MKRLAGLALISTALAGCSGYNQLTAFGCEVDRPIGVCKIEGSKANPTPKLHKTGNGLNMTPKSLCTEPGANVTITITPTGSSDLGTVLVAAKNLQKAVWFLGSNDDPANPDQIKITIPAEAPEGNYEYVVVDRASGKCLDPRWEVQ